MKTQYECVFISNWPLDANCYQCGRSREEHDKDAATVNLDDVQRHSGDNGRSLSTWYDEVERNRREDEKERIEKEWYENERSRAATADNYWNDDLDE